MSVFHLLSSFPVFLASLLLIINYCFYIFAATILSPRIRLPLFIFSFILLSRYLFYYFNLILFSSFTLSFRFPSELSQLSKSISLLRILCLRNKWISCRLVIYFQMNCFQQPGVFIESDHRAELIRENILGTRSRTDHLKEMSDKKH